MVEDGRMRPFDEEYDVVVIGYGYAGGIAAIEAADAGARVLLVEKMPVPGGISIVSAGSVKCARSAADALAYLTATNAGTAPDSVLRALADGMVEADSYVHALARAVGAEAERVGVDSAKGGGNYPFPGYRTFYSCVVKTVPDFDQAALYPHVCCRPSAGGPRMFRMVELNVAARPITLRLATPALRLISEDGAVVGVALGGAPGEARRVGARKGVVLACGGFENDQAMQRQYWQGKPVFPAASRGNTGDGVRMAQAAGADLWHMWHYHGTYAFRHADPDWPYALRVKRLPDWNPAHKALMDVVVAWIVVDRRGRRYMTECPPYAQDTSQRPMDLFDPETQSYPRIPSWLISDEKGRRMYPLGDVRSNDPNYAYEWSDDNLKEIENGILRQADTLDEVAAIIGVDPAVVAATVARWNALCAAGEDADFGRPSGTLMAIDTPPYIVAQVWPAVSNTQGGPVHDARQRVLDPFGQPIPGLYAAGELGSLFGHLYLSGGNLAECFVTGRIAGREAAGRLAFATGGGVA